MWYFSSRFCAGMLWWLWWSWNGAMFREIDGYLCDVWCNSLGDPWCSTYIAVRLRGCGIWWCQRSNCHLINLGWGVWCLVYAVVLVGPWSYTFSHNVASVTAFSSMREILRHLLCPWEVEGWLSLSSMFLLWSISQVDSMWGPMGFDLRWKRISW